MKLDGHAKLTNRSIELFRSRCAQATDIFIRATVCQLPQLHTFDLEWTNAEESNEADNSMIFRYIAIQELTVFGESFHRLHDGYLTREVVAVDIEPFKLPLHVLESGQRYHFMRRNASASVRGLPSRTDQPLAQADDTGSAHQQKRPPPSSRGTRPPELAEERSGFPPGACAPCTSGLLLARTHPQNAL